jgi:hypothetical protein
MKKLLFATLALGIALGSVSFAAQDTSSDTSAKKTKKHKKNKKGADSSSTSNQKM